MCLREHRGARPRPGWAGPPLYRAGPSSLGLVLSLASLLGRGSVPGRARASGTCCAVSTRRGGPVAALTWPGGAWRGPRWAGSGPGGAAADGEENENTWENCGNLTCTSDAVPAQPFWSVLSVPMVFIRKQVCVRPAFTHG